MDQAHHWLLLTASLPGREASTARVRLWRTLKELGAASLRDGVSLVPASSSTRERLRELSFAVESEGGSVWLFEIAAQAPVIDTKLTALFDRRDAYTALAPALAALRKELSQLDESAARRRLRQIERDFDSIATTDFFPNTTQSRQREKLDKLRAFLNARFSPEEPTSSSIAITRRDRADFRGQLWATRKRLWVDRAASAWLIRHFIDPQATFRWLDHPADCPPEAHGFDFDGATFTHVGDRVTFEVLLATFDLDQDVGLTRMGELVHCLDVGGEMVPEAAGIEAVLGGARETTANDDALLDAITPVLHALYRHFLSTPQ